MMTSSQSDPPSIFHVKILKVKCIFFTEQESYRSLHLPLQYDPSDSTYNDMELKMAAKAPPLYGDPDYDSDSSSPSDSSTSSSSSGGCPTRFSRLPIFPISEKSCFRIGKIGKILAKKCDFKGEIDSIFSIPDFPDSQFSRFQNVESGESGKLGKF